MDPSGRVGKISEPEIRSDQGLAPDDEKWGISWFDDVCGRQIDVSAAFSPCWRTLWKLDMARRTCFREQYYTGMRGISVAGKTAGNIRRKLFVNIWWFFINISGSMYSFGLALFVVQDMCVFLQWLPAGGLGKSLSQRLDGTRSRDWWWKMRNFMVWGRLRTVK